MNSLLFAIVACCAFACSSQKHAEDPGPAQRAGASVDQGAHDVKESAKDAGHEVGEETEKTGDKLQEKTKD